METNIFQRWEKINLESKNPNKSTAILRVPNIIFIFNSEKKEKR